MVRSISTEIGSYVVMTLTGDATIVTSVIVNVLGKYSPSG